ncbi:hypothetical protein BH11ARM2_BH11ARM2_22540 [soil metagenome]
MLPIATPVPGVAEMLSGINLPDIMQRVPALAGKPSPNGKPA